MHAFLADHDKARPRRRTRGALSGERSLGRDSVPPALGGPHTRVLAFVNSMSGGRNVRHAPRDALWALRG